LNETRASLQRALGCEFRDERWLRLALTHRSAGHEHNERLEFLGDALLNFVIGEALFQARPTATEGELSRLRAALVCEAALAKIARRIGLGEALQLGPGELKSGGFRRDSILADALEALIGALYLDRGIEAARAACLRLYAEALQQLPQTLPKDAKTRLQEALQGQGRPLPEYVVVGESGPAHRRRFRVRCRLPDSGRQSEGEGASRRQAEQEAAQRMLEEEQSKAAGAWHA
jgi:ribonuclease-3